MPSLTWHDADEIGFRLHEKFGDLDPLTVRFTDLHRRVAELEGFDDDPDLADETLLEAIQMAWYDYWREDS